MLGGDSFLFSFNFPEGFQSGDVDCLALVSLCQLFEKLIAGSLSGREGRQVREPQVPSIMARLKVRMTKQ